MAWHDSNHLMSDPTSVKTSRRRSVIIMVFATQCILIAFVVADVVVADVDETDAQSC
jgi:hypothetical protein